MGAIMKTYQIILMGEILQLEAPAGSDTLCGILASTSSKFWLAV